MAEEGGDVARADLGPPVYVDPTPADGKNPPDWKEWSVHLDPTTKTKRLYLNNHGINQMGMWVPAKDIPIANKLWIAQYGSLHAGPFNTGGCDPAPYSAGSPYSCDCFWPRSFTCSSPTACQTAPDGPDPEGGNTSAICTKAVDTICGTARSDCQSCMNCCKAHHSSLIRSCPNGASEMSEVCCPD